MSECHSSLQSAGPSPHSRARWIPEERLEKGSSGREDWEEKEGGIKREREGGMKREREREG